MIRLEITADSAEQFQAQLMYLAQDATLANQVRQSFAQRQATQSTEATQVQQPVAAQTSEPEVIDPPKKPRGRKPAPQTIEATAEPEPQVKAEEDPLDVPDFLKKAAPEKSAEIAVPKNIDEMRALLNKVVGKCGVESVEAIVNRKLGFAKLSAVPVEKYGEMAALCEEALAS